MARWRLAESSGAQTARDTAGNSTGTATDITWTADHGGAAAFNGTTSAITTPGPVVDTARSFTFSVWVYPYPTSGDPDESILSQQGPGSTGFNLSIGGVQNAPLIAMDMVDRNQSVGLATWVDWNRWYLVTGVVDAGQQMMVIYINGSPSLSGNLPADFVPLTGTGSLTIGSPQLPWMSNFHGMLSDVQAYPVALTQAQVAGIYNGQYPVPGEGMVRSSWQRDQDGLVTGSVDPLGRTTNYEYDADGQAVATTSPAVMVENGDGGAPVSARPVTFAGYNTFGERVEVKDPRGNVTVTGYDAAGRRISTQLPSYPPPGSSTSITPQTSARYDDMGQLATSTDPLGNVTSYTYDQLGRVAKVTAPNLGETTYTYDLLGDRLSATDPNGARTTATYDYLGRRVTSTQVVRQDNNSAYTTNYVYGTNGWLSEVHSPVGVVEKTDYNAAGETLTATDGANAITRYAYDGAGRPVRTTLADGTYTTTSYDPAGRETATRNYDATGTLLATQSSEYDAAGNVTAATDARGTRVTFGYDSTGMVTTETQPISATDSITMSFGYDLAGNRTRFTDGRGNPFLTTYNSWGLPESRTEPATAAYPNAADRTFTSVYDAAGRAVSERMPGGVSVTNTYNSMGDLTGQAGAGAEVATADRSFGYDLGGRLTSASAPGGTNTFSYDDRGLLLSTAGPSGNATFSYTPDGEMASRTDAAGRTDYRYDTADRITDLDNADSSVHLQYQYNTLSQVTSIVTEVCAGCSSSQRQLQYDSQHRLTSDELKSPTGASVAKISYGYDANGNETSKTTTGFAGSAANTYQYDLADRLTLWNNGTADTTYAYDKSGNRTSIGSQQFTYDQRNQLLTGGGSSFAYTPRGTLSQTAAGTGTDLTQTDAFGQIVRQDAAGSTQNYAYDALGRLLRPGFSYSGLGNALASSFGAMYTRDNDDNLVGAYLYTMKTYAWTDQHTDVVGQFTATGTALTGSTTYDPLGRIVATNGMLGDLGYQSAWTDFNTGRVNMWNRWYNTLTGQFDTRDPANLDPVPDPVDANRFAYVDDNPLTGTDPSGLCLICDIFKATVSTTAHVFTAGGRAIGHAAVSTASSVYHFGRSAVSYGYHGLLAIGRGIGRTISRGLHAFSRGLHAVTGALSRAGRAAVRTISHYYSNVKHYAKQKYHAVTRWVGRNYHRARQYVAHKIDQARRVAKVAYHHVKQAGKLIVTQTARQVVHLARKVNDAYHTTEKWVKDHKNAIIEGLATAGAILAGVACTAATAGVAAVACMVGASAAINLAKDGAEGKIHNWGDAFGSLGTGGVEGLAGVFGGVVGGKAASALSGRLGRYAGTLGGRMLAGSTAGGISDAVTQLATTGHVNLRGVANGAAIGAVFGGFAKGRTPTCRHSFAPATGVLLATGAVLPIKDIKVGDRVAATDPRTGRTTAEPVTALHINHDRDLADVTLQDTRTGKTTTLHTTWHHPFWNATTGAWAEAAQLKPGDRLRSADGETTRTVAAIKTWTGLDWMYDLTVADIHTYYVQAGGGSVLVHNCDDRPSPLHIARTADVATPRNKAMFWTGLPMEEANAIADSMGGVTLEATMRSRGIVLDEKHPQFNEAMHLLARRFAEGASGETTVIIGPEPRPAGVGVWNLDERPALDINLKVTRLDAFYPASGEWQTLFERPGP
jgi:RHS repeat-associated protein